MKSKILILYSSVDGQTLKICRVLQDELETKNEVDLVPIDGFNDSIEKYDKVVIGASIRYGVHNKKIIDYINTHTQQLESLRTAFFSVNLVARKPEKNMPETNPYVIKLFKAIAWKPTIVKVFAGKLDYKKYPFLDRMMIQLIMWMTKGPTDPKSEIEYTDWEKVKLFAKTLQSL
ncbi:MAG: menaquinone-dependent protoporphyrinogen IX dehydrogenase [Bacteroidota bacterium]